MICTWFELQALRRYLGVLETPDVIGGLRIGEIEQTASFAELFRMFITEFLSINHGLQCLRRKKLFPIGEGSVT